MRLRTRVTLVSAALMAVVLAATGVFVYLRLQAELQRTVDETLRSRADAELLFVQETGSLPLAQPDDAFAQLIEHVWDFAYDGDSNVVDVYVRYLRNKVDRPFGRDQIETVRGAGYRLRDEPV